MNSKLCLYVCLVLVVYLSMSFLPGYSSSHEAIDVTKNLNMAIYDDALPLDQRIRCIAVDSCGNVAVRSGSSQDRCDYIISVYSKTGVFLYGYEVTFKNQRGYGILFFDSEDTLCYGATFSSEEVSAQNILIQFEPHSTQYKSYALVKKIEVTDGEVQYVNGIPVFISSQSPYSTAYCTECSYALRNEQTNDLYIAYNQQDAYNNAIKRQNKINILAVIFTIVFVFLLGTFLSWCDMNRKS